MSTSEPMDPKNYYLYFDKEHIVDEWLLVKTPLPMMSSLMVYLGFVLYLGPWLMRGRSPFQLKSVMKAYNLFQVSYNVWMVYMFFSSKEALRYLTEDYCQPGDPEQNVNARYVFHVFSWHYYCSKYLDLLDTFIMVLRKKQSHVTYLHVYHHSIMVFLMWVSMRYFKAQQIVGPAIVNNCVHMVMYSYYFLACFGPQVQKYLWWKRYLTRLQLIQFAAILCFLSYLYFNQCNVSQMFNFIWIVNVSIIAGFFVNFYIQTYIVKKKRVQE